MSTIKSLYGIEKVDPVLLNYEGQTSKNVFALTITSRRKYTNLYIFRKALYEFLKSIDYKYEIRGFMEFHGQKGRQDKVHAHGVCYFGNPPKGNKTNPFNFRIDKITDPKGWEKYCVKDIFQTLKTHHNIQTGLFNYYKKPVCLWGEDE